MQAQLAELYGKKTTLQASIDAARHAQHERPLLHPDYVLEVRDGLDDEDRRDGAVDALRAMLRQLTLTPREDGTLAIELEGEVGEMLAAASPAHAPDLPRQITMVAGAGFEPATFGL